MAKAAHQVGALIFFEVDLAAEVDRFRTTNRTRIPRSIWARCGQKPYAGILVGAVSREALLKPASYFLGWTEPRPRRKLLRAPVQNQRPTVGARVAIMSAAGSRGKLSELRSLFPERTSKSRAIGIDFSSSILYL